MSLGLDVAIVSVTTNVAERTFCVTYNVSKSGQGVGQFVATFGLGTSRETVRDAITEAISLRPLAPPPPPMSVGDAFSV